jgi:hypothetical protein
MKTFSQRMGLKPVRQVIQKDSVDEELRNYLWTGVGLYYFSDLEDYTSNNTEPKRILFTQLWVWHYHKRLDEMPSHVHRLVDIVKKEFLESSWNEMFDLLEFIPNHYIDQYDNDYDDQNNQSFYEFANKGLETFMSAYRFVDGLLTEITSEQEIASIEQSLDNSSKFSGVHQHLRRALELMTDRKEPDYRNSIKESISAVEGLAKLISGKSKDTLAASLNKIKGKINLHQALEQGFKNIYGYTSDEGGIRHALTEAASCELEDAKFMLISCSAFVNYLIVKCEKAEITL